MERTFNIPTITIERDKIHWSVPVVVYRRETGRAWAAYCPLLKSLGFSTENDEQALVDHDADAAAFVKVHAHRGTLESALLNLGWTRVDAHTFQALPNTNIPAGVLHGDTRVVNQSLVLA